MAQFTQLLFSGNFASSMAYYQDYYSEFDLTARMVVAITIESHVSVRAIVDTGAPWCVLDPDVVGDLRVAKPADYSPEIELNIRGINYRGKVSRLRITIQAIEGENLDIEASAFVPTLSPDEVWPYPNFVGLEGFLSRIRFAVDPAENAFYFGSLE